MAKFRCFLCNKVLGKNPRRADTHEDQWVFVGSECYTQIREAGAAGLEACPNGVRLWELTRDRITYFEQKGLL
jgi:hypothetical protein